MWAYASAMYAKINAHTFQTNHARKHACIPSMMVLEKIYNGDMNVFGWSHLKKKKKKWENYMGKFHNKCNNLMY